MKNLLLTTVISLALTSPAFAAGSDSGGHDDRPSKGDSHGHDDGRMDGHGEMMVGMPGPVNVSEKLAQADVEYATGKIKKIDAKAGKVTIIHGPLISLDMPAMTMVFRADKAMIEKMSKGQNIEFVADRIKGKLTVTAIK